MNLRTLVACVSILVASPGQVSGQATPGEDSDAILTIDHYVLHASTVPSVRGERVPLYVRERARAGSVLRAPNLEDRVVLFVHGAGTPAEVAFDVPYEDYSWMEYLARAGFDVFSLDATGYGRSFRPPAMNDPCNVSASQQEQLVGLMLEEACEPTHPGALTTIQSDWDDIGAVVDYIRELRNVASVSLIGWSLGGPRTGGYAAANPGKVSRMVLLAPAYNRSASADPPEDLPGGGAPMTLQSRADFTSNWDRQVGCEAQYDPRASDEVWAAMLASDPVGATWGPGVRRAPRTLTWGWNQEIAGETRIPLLAVAGVHDAQVRPGAVRNLYEDWGGEKKVFLDLGCASHNAMWEENHLLLFEASREWLTWGTVQGMESGTLGLGYE